MIKRLLALLVVCASPCFGTGMTYSQGVGGQSGGGVTSYSVALASNPSSGDCVLVGVAADNQPTSGMTVQDGAANSYTKSTNSPQTMTNDQSVWLFYYVAGATANKTINFSWTGANDVDVFVDDFQPVGGTCAYDKDAGGVNTFAGTTINLPSITPTHSGSLLYSAAGPQNHLGAPAAGATLGSWTGAAGNDPSGSNTGALAEYDLSATGATVPDFTDNGAGDTVAVVVMAFSFTSGVSCTTPTLTLMGVGTCIAENWHNLFNAATCALADTACTEILELCDQNQNCLTHTLASVSAQKVCDTSGKCLAVSPTTTLTVSLLLNETLPTPQTLTSPLGTISFK